MGGTNYCFSKYIQTYISILTHPVSIECFKVIQFVLLKFLRVGTLNKLEIDVTVGTWWLP